MVHIHCAYTEQINPADAEPVLSRDQVGRLPQLFSFSTFRIVVRGDRDIFNIVVRLRNLVD
jgi:hypothetical protein